MSERLALEVAVGVMIRSDGAFLIARRPEGKPMAGYWEFPGGKCEPGETIFNALCREFLEELGVEVLHARPWARRTFDYPHARVNLHFWRVDAWHGEPRSLEGQEFCWERPEWIQSEPWLPGSLPLKRWLRLPGVLAISNAAELGVEVFLGRLRTWLDAHDNTAQPAMLVLREPDLAGPDIEKLIETTRLETQRHGVRLLLSSRHLALAKDGDGVHFTARDLLACKERPRDVWCGASCHTAADLAHAGALELDYATLGPVLPTRSHPDAEGLGWPAFMALAGGSAIPVYALGGLQKSDEITARNFGGHGIGMQRSAWQER